MVDYLHQELDGGMCSVNSYRSTVFGIINHSILLDQQICDGYWGFCFSHTAILLGFQVIEGDEGGLLLNSLSFGL